jgi:hypothetical protein
MRNALCLAGYTYIVATGLFLSYVVPCNGGLGHPDGMIGLSLGIEWLLIGLLSGLVIARNERRNVPAGDILVGVLFGPLLPLGVAIDRHQARRFA